MEVTEVHPVGRYEWEQIIRRSRLNGLITGSGRPGKTGRATRGGLTATTVKAVALAYASYANDRGAEVFPGDATVAVDLECGLKTVKAVKARLLALGLMQKVRGRRGDRGEEYRLTLPTDLLERVEVLSPAQHKLAAHRIREAARGKPNTAGGSGGSPDRDAICTDSGGPPDPPNGTQRPDGCGSGGSPELASGGSAGPALGGPADPHTDHYRTSTTKTDHSEEDVCTAVTVSRAGPVAQDQIFPDEVAKTRPATRPGPPAGRPPDNRPSQRPRPKPVWWADADVAGPASPGRTAFAAARAALAAQRAAAQAATPQRTPGDAWQALVAATDPASPARTFEGASA